MKQFTVLEVRKSYEFAKGMIGNHRPDFDGAPGRSDKEIFLNDIQGKLAEIAVLNEIASISPSAKINGELDFGIYKRGIWDNFDLQVNEKYLNIKSIKHFSVIFMIECSRYDNKGHYIYKNNTGDEIVNDFYILVKIKIQPTISWDDLKNDFMYFRHPYADFQKKDISIKRVIGYEIAGGISHKDFWDKKIFIPKGTIITVNNMKQYMINNISIDKLTDTEGEHLKVDNFGLHCDYLHSLKKLGFLKIE